MPSDWTCRRRRTSAWPSSKPAVAADGIFAPPGEVAGLRQVVSDAAHHGINLKLVVIDHNPPNDPPLRDVATVVGSSYPDATVLVLSPSNVGSYSMHFPRSTLEIGEDNAKTGNAVVSAQNFLHQLVTPQFPWTGFTVAGTARGARGGRRRPGSPRYGPSGRRGRRLPTTQPAQVLRQPQSDLEPPRHSSRPPLGHCSVTNGKQTTAVSVTNVSIAP